MVGYGTWVVVSIRVGQIDDETHIGYDLQKGFGRQPKILLHFGVDMLQKIKKKRRELSKYTRALQWAAIDCSIYAKCPEGWQLIKAVDPWRYLIKQKQFNLIFMWGPCSSCHFYA